MLKARSVMKSAAGAGILTLGTVAITVLTLMFTSGSDEPVERTAFFGSMMFETVEKSNGALGITAGVANPVPLIVLFLLLTALFTMIQAIYRVLKERREQLLSAAGS